MTGLTGQRRNLGSDVCRQRSLIQFNKISIANRTGFADNVGCNACECIGKRLCVFSAHRKSLVKFVHTHRRTLDGGLERVRRSAAVLALARRVVHQSDSASARLSAAERACSGPSSIEGRSVNVACKSVKMTSKAWPFSLRQVDSASAPDCSIRSFSARSRKASSIGRFRHCSTSAFNSERIRLRSTNVRSSLRAISILTRKSSSLVSSSTIIGGMAGIWVNIAFSEAFRLADTSSALLIA